MLENINFKEKFKTHISQKYKENYFLIRTKYKVNCLYLQKHSKGTNKKIEIKLQFKNIQLIFEE